MIPDTEWSLREELRDSKLPEKQTYLYYLAKISRLAMGQFRYESDELKDLFLIEKFLWLDGKVMIWYSEVLGWIISRCMETGYNFNGIAIRWKPILEQPLNSPIIPTPEMGLDDKCVVIYDIPSRMCMSSFCTHWINEIADTNETIKSQIMLQKTPMIAVCDNPKDKLSLKKAIVDIANNVKVLFVGKDFRADIRTFEMNAPFNVSDLQAHLKTKEAEMLEFLGIDSQSAFQKKERLISAEQESNGQVLTYLISDRFQSRKNGLDELKKKGCTVEIFQVMLNDPNDKDSNGIDDDSQESVDSKDSKDSEDSKDSKDSKEKKGVKNDPKTA